MRVLLTGASGFVGSHILDALRARDIPTRVLLRSTSRRQFLPASGPGLEMRMGSLADAPSLREAMRQVTHVVHCAGATKALNPAGFHEANQIGTRQVVEAANQFPGAIDRLVLISSLAAGGPASADRPAREEDPPRPVSAYGQSKLAGESEVRTRAVVPHVIVRPPGVYGPRDDGFLSLFQAVKTHVVPRFVGSLAALSLVFARDLAEAVVVCLTHSAAEGRTYYVASPAVLRGEEFAREIARQMNTWTVTVPLPAPVLWLACLAQEGLAVATRRPRLLGLRKYRELRAPGWVCDPTRLREELGFVAATSLEDGVAETLAWYRREGWL